MRPRRALEPGEPYRAGDQILTPNGWEPVPPESLPRAHAAPAAATREIRPQSPSYRWLDAGETVRVGDEWRDRTGRWRPVDLSVGDRVYRDDRMRRALGGAPVAPRGARPSDVIRVQQLRLVELGVEEVD